MVPPRLVLTLQAGAVVLITAARVVFSVDRAKEFWEKRSPLYPTTATTVGWAVPTIENF